MQFRAADPAGPEAQARQAERDWAQWVAVATIAAIASYFAAQFGLALLAQPGGVAVFWPSSGIIAGARLALGSTVERPFAVGVALATFLANIQGDRSASLAVAFALVNVVEFVLVARIAETFGRPFQLDTLWRVTGFFLAALLGCAVASLLATFLIWFLATPASSLFDTWQTWFRSDTIGIIGIAPFLITMGRDFWTRTPLRVHLEGAALLAVLGAITFVLFSASADESQAWAHTPPVAAMFPLLLLVAARLPLVYPAAAVAVVTMIVVVTTLFGIGPYSHPVLPMPQALLFAQVVIVSASVCSLALAALVAERREAEARQRILISELDHRVKNSLAQVQAVVERSQEGARTIDGFVSSLGGRIKSMARIQQRLSDGAWKGLWLETLIRDELEPYLSPTNVSVSGPPLRLRPAAGQPLTMVIHELATNAAKYGALSSPYGHVDVRWRIEPRESGEPALKLTWREQGGPPVTHTPSEGYGTTTIRGILPYEVAGTVDLRFLESGVVCEIVLPASNAVSVSRFGDSKER